MSTSYGRSEFAGEAAEPAQVGGAASPRIKTRLLRRAVPCRPQGGSLEPSAHSDQMRTRGSLTVIGGPCRGTTFDLTEQSMRVGRGSDQEIHLPQDDTISRECHAIVGFSHEFRRFMIFSGGKPNPIHVNGVEVKDATILENQDILRIGQSTFCLFYH